MNTTILSCAVWFLIIPSVYNSDTNLALHRPAYLSSTYSNAFANIAVDGIYDRSPVWDYSDAPSAHTNDPPGGPNWFVVDLGREYYVQYVVVTNRVDCCGERLNYFIVGVTNSFSPSNPPVRDHYPLCGQYTYTTPTGATLTLNCSSSTPPGQFVIIQQPANGTGYMAICELEVYGYENIANQFIGCYLNISSGVGIQPKTSLTIQWCVIQCRDLNLTFASLQFGNSCFCCDEVQVSTSAEDCQLTCNGDTNQYCGGLMSYAVYAVCPIGYYGSECGSICQCGTGNPCNVQTGSCFTGCNETTNGSLCNLSDCSENNNTCGNNEDCKRVDLKFTSVTRCQCDDGFHRINFWDACADTDECRNASACDRSSENCINTIGGFRCECFDGYYSENIQQTHSCIENKTMIPVAPPTCSTCPCDTRDPPAMTTTIVLAVLLGLLVLVSLTLAIDDVRLRLRKHSHPASSPFSHTPNRGNGIAEARAGDVNLHETTEQNYDSIADTKEEGHKYESISSLVKETNVYTTLND